MIVFGIFIAFFSNYLLKGVGGAADWRKDYNVIILTIKDLLVRPMIGGSYSKWNLIMSQHLVI